jgi:hypothetical protein
VVLAARAGADSEVRLTVRTSETTGSRTDLDAPYDALLARDPVLARIADEHGRSDPSAGRVEASQAAATSPLSSCTWSVSRSPPPSPSCCSPASSVGIVVPRVALRAWRFEGSGSLVDGTGRGPAVLLALAARGQEFSPADRALTTDTSDV